MTCVVCGSTENLFNPSKCDPCEAQYPTMPIPGICQCGASVDLGVTAICDDCHSWSDYLDYQDMVRDLGPML